MVRGFTRNAQTRIATVLGAALLFLGVAGTTAAQDASQASSDTERRLLLIVTEGDGAGYSADTLQLISRAILVGLQLDPGMRTAGAVILDEPVGANSATDDARSQSAGAAGAEGWLWIEVSPTAGDTALHVRTFDLLGQGRGLDETVTIAGDLGTADVASADWSGLAAVAASALPARGGQDAAAGRPSSATLSIHGTPGSHVTVTGGPVVTLDADGNGSVTLGVPAAYTLRATRPGYSPSSESLFLSSDREVTISQSRGARWAVEASLSDGSWPGGGFSWFIVPDTLSLGLDLSTYLFGLALTEQQVFWSLPLTNLGLRVGVYFAPPDSGFRTYTSLGVFTRVIHAAQYFGLDPVSPLAARLALGAEIGRGKSGGVFLEYDPSLYFTSLPSLFRASLGTDPPRGWIFAPGIAVDLLTLRVGYRWTL